MKRYKVGSTVLLEVEKETEEEIFSEIGLLLDNSNPMKLHFLTLALEVFEGLHFRLPIPCYSSRLKQQDEKRIVNALDLLRKTRLRWNRLPEGLQREISGRFIPLRYINQAGLKRLTSFFGRIINQKSSINEKELFHLLRSVNHKFFIFKGIFVADASICALNSGIAFSKGSLRLDVSKCAGPPRWKSRQFKVPCSLFADYIIGVAHQSYQSLMKTYGVSNLVTLSFHCFVKGKQVDVSKRTLSALVWIRPEKIEQQFLRTLLYGGN